MDKRRMNKGLIAAATALASLQAAAERGRAFELTTKSPEAKRLLNEVRDRIERFQFGPETTAVARKLVTADPDFALGHYVLAVFLPPDQAQAELDKAVALAAKASEGERRFIEAMALVNANAGASPQKAIPLLEKLAADYPGERRVFSILGQVYAGQNEPDQARVAFEKAEAIGPSSPRIRAFLANDDLLKERYQKARTAFEAVEKELPKGAAPFAVRYGVAFSHLYEGDPDAAIKSLQSYLDEYRGSGLSQAFPEVFIWNSIARINLEAGRLDAAMAAYEKGYESVPGSTLPQDQKDTWFGRLRHGKCRTLAKLGKHDEAWREAEAIHKMIVDGGEPAKQYLPAYHYLVGYIKLEKGEIDAAIEHLRQANPDDPFHKLLLARALERKGDSAEARKAYAGVVASRNNGIERALAYPEAKRKLATLPS